MILSQPASIGPKEIEEALLAAYMIFDKKWLQSQYQRRPNDPLLYEKKSVISPQFSINAIEYGTTGDMHPIAEAVRVGEAIIGLTHPRFGLVISDQTMPEMTGIEFANEVLDIRADMPIIMVESRKNSGAYR